MQKLFKVFVLNTVFLMGLITILLTSSPVHADNFYPGGDSADCNFAIATSVSYRSLPNSCSGNNCLSFNNGDVFGASGNYPANHTLSSVADVTFPDAHRFRGVADRVGVPPNTQIDIGFYVHNYSGHSITPVSGYLFVSRSNPNNGDWGRLGSGGNVGGIDYLYYGSTLVRNGRYVNIGNLGSYPANSLSNQPAGKTIYSFTTIQPIQIQSRTATPEYVNGDSLRIRYDLTIKNVSSYNLPNIHIVDTLPSSEVFDTTQTFSAGQTQTFTYYANMGSNYSNSITTTPVKISDPNSHKEEAAIASNNMFDSNPETKTIIINRTDSGTPAGWTGRQPDFTAYPSGDYYFIELIPYTVYSDSTTLNIPPVLSVTKTVTDSDESNVKSNNVKPNDELTYNITVSNTGGHAHNVTIVDDYDESLLSIVDANGGVDNGNTMTWSIPILQNGETKTFQIKAKVKAPLPFGIYQAPNTVSVHSDETTPINDSTQTTIRSLPHNEIKKYVFNQTAIDKGRLNNGRNVDDPHYGADANSVFANAKDVHAIAGDTLKYTLLYRNTGDADSPDTFITDHLPKYITDINGNQLQLILQIDVTNVSDNVVVTETLTGFDIVWRIGSLQLGNNWQSKSFTVRILADSFHTLSANDSLRLLNNVSEIASDDTIVAKDTDNAIVRVDQPNISINKTSNKPEYQSDEEATYSLHIQNIGSEKAFGIVTDTLPIGLKYISSDYSANKTSINGQTLNFEVDLNAGESLTILVKVKFEIPVTDLKIFNNVVQYKYADGNSNVRPIVNDNLNIRVHAPILELKKEQVLPEFVSPGQAIVYVIKYKNSGTGYSPNTVITDTLPDHVQFVEFLPTDSNITGTYNSETKTITWNLGKLNSGEEGSVSFRVVITIPTPNGSEIKNVSIISNDVTDEVKSEVITATTSSCCMGGFIWEDPNSNGKYEDNEKGIPNVRINIGWAETEYLPEGIVDVFTNGNGHYEYTGLPYFTVLTIRVFKPIGYDNITTPYEFKIVLLPPTSDGGIQDYMQDGVRYLTATGCIDFFNAGIYRDVVIAQTGLSALLPISVGVSLMVIGSLLIKLIIKSKKKNNDHITDIP